MFEDLKRLINLERAVLTQMAEWQNSESVSKSLKIAKLIAKMTAGISLIVVCCLIIYPILYRMLSTMTETYELRKALKALGRILKL